VALKVIERGAGWQTALEEHAHRLLANTSKQMGTEERELPPPPKALASRLSPVVEIGAGSSRLAVKHGGLNLSALCVEPGSAHA